MLMPATMLLVRTPPAVYGSARYGIGATPYSSGFIPACCSDGPAACQSSIAALRPAKSARDSFLA
jgi:hypothetical protein